MSARKLILVVSLAALGGLSGLQSAHAARNEDVAFRCAKWKAAHFNSEKDAQKIHDTLKQLGCEVKKEAHDGHTDIVYRCSSWRLHKAKSHDEAHQWEQWFKTYGFETKHSH